MNCCLFRLTEFKLSLKGNLKVMESLRGFYHDLFDEMDKLDDNEKVAWWGAPKDLGEGLLKEMDQTIQDTKDILDKAEQTSMKAEDREKFVSLGFDPSHFLCPKSPLAKRETYIHEWQMQKRLQNDLSRLNQREASVMRVFQFVALIFLPVTVVSVSPVSNNEHIILHRKPHLHCSSVN